MSHSHPTKTPPPPTPTFLKLTFPAPRVVLIRMDRPKALNAMTTAAQWEMDSVWKWFDAEPNLSVAILTGTGRAFSAGADLKEWNGSMAPDADPSKRMGKAPEFTPLSRRMGKKPIIAAVNGLAMGGGCEFVVNCDIVLATEEATFGLPEVKRGVAAIGGALPRLIRNIGLQRASEFALTGRTATAEEMHSWGVVNKIIPKNGDLIQEAVSLAASIAENSPDSIICTRAGLRQGWQTDVETAVGETLSKEFEELQRGENILEGLKAFTEKRKPVWRGSRL